MPMFSDSDVASFREANIEEYLPILHVYANFQFDTWHMLESCEGGELVKLKFFGAPTLASSIMNCDACFTSQPGQHFVRILTELMDLRQFLTMLNKAENNLSNAISKGFYTIDSLGITLSILRAECAEWLNSYENSRWDDSPLLPLLPSWRKQVKKIDNDMVALLKTDAACAKVTRAIAYHSVNWDEKYNALLLPNLPLVDTFNLAVVEAYGTALASGRRLVTGPAMVLSFLLNEHAKALQHASPVFVAEGTSDSVLEIMAQLWEPGATSALGDANKALLAAWELTPGR